LNRTSAKFNFNDKYALVSSLKSTLTLFDLDTSEIVLNYSGSFIFIFILKTFSLKGILMSNILLRIPMDILMENKNL